LTARLLAATRDTMFLMAASILDNRTMITTIYFGVFKCTKHCLMEKKGLHLKFPLTSHS
jgi:hypothetical protein